VQARRFRRSRLWPEYVHGCGGICGQVPGFCPQRINARPATGEVKSKAGRRTVGLPLQTVLLLLDVPVRGDVADGLVERRDGLGCWAAAVESPSPVIALA
jgi:hypothetical protein